MSLFLSTSRNPLDLSLISLVVNDDLDILTVSPPSSLTPSLPSAVTYTEFFLHCMEHSSITESQFRTAGLLSRECGQIGVTQTADNEGSSIGPPADKEYAVDPVAVAAITPSAL